ncbi:MAG TPA: DUF6069 family protein [Ktedonobacteraceae bacterium]|nr:DUF6069 family protein [Ktedonobacteraceae bacterium]
MAPLLTREHVSSRKLVWIGPLAIVCTLIVNLLVRAVVVAFFGVSSTFQYFQVPYIIGSTIIYLLLAILAFVLVSRFARRPVRFYCILALIALLVSLLFPVMALTGGLHAPGMNVHIFWSMIAMHITSAAIVVGLLATLTRK